MEAWSLDKFSVLLFSISGTLTAYKYKRLDLFGLLFVAWITAIGGGTLRDILLNAHPIAWVSHSSYLLAIVSGFTMAMIFKETIYRMSRPLIYVDALAISFGALAGLEKALELGANPMAAAVFGVITATVGGIIRDTICNEVPMVLKREIYASAVLLGCIVFLLTSQILGWPHTFCYILGFFTITLTRLFSVRYGWSLELDKVFRFFDRWQVPKVKRGKR